MNRSEEIRVILSEVHECFFGKQKFLSFSVIRVIDTTIDGTYGCALRFIMEANTFRAFFMGDVVYVHVSGIVFHVG